MAQLNISMTDFLDLDILVTVYNNATNAETNAVISSLEWGYITAKILSYSLFGLKKIVQQQSMYFQEVFSLFNCFLRNF